MNFRELFSQIGLEHNFSAFDGTEVHPMVRLDEQGKPRRADEPLPAGQFWGWEACDSDNPFIAAWGVFGHKPGEGLVSLHDFMGDGAKQNAFRFAEYIDSRMGFVGSAVPVSGSR